MKYQFDSKRFARMMDERNLSVYKILKTGIRTNHNVVAGWRDGNVMRGEDIVDVCNIYGLNPIEFFLADDKPMSEIYLHEPPTLETTNKNESQIAYMQQQIQNVREMAEIEKKHLQAIADLKEQHSQEKSELEKKHLRELMQKEIDLAHREADIRDTIRRELQAEYEEQIRGLRSQLLDLTTQYHKFGLHK